MNNIKLQNLPDIKGFFGNYGGCFIDEFGEDLKNEFKKIEEEFLKLKNDEKFNNELKYLLKHFCGRPTPVYFAKNLSKEYNCEIYFKREDLNHTGAHKINHCLGEALLTKHLGKKKVIAETGAGQHGVAMATAAALLNLECDIYMGEVDIKKAKPNVDRMKILGANVISVKSGTKTLKEAVDGAFCAYLKEYKTALYAIGSVVGPHPFPMIVEYFQSIVGREAKEQFKELTGSNPDAVIACVGGGSNAIGIFSGFLENSENEPAVELIGVEPLGKGEKIGQNAASLTFGKQGILHGFKCLLLQDENGKIANAYSVASGLDYPGVGPKHCYLKETKKAHYETISDIEAIKAFYELSKKEGIIPALESAHAVAYGLKYAKENAKETDGKKILINLSGRGDKDIEFVLENYPENSL